MKRFQLLFTFGVSVVSVFLGSTDVFAAVLATTFYHNDALGSPVAATDDSGSVKWREEYRPYGDKIINDPEADENTRWYTGHPHDSETGLTYAGARYYDPVVGRFMEIDPVGVLGAVESSPVMFNRYAYAINNPYTFIDPDGREAVSISLTLNLPALAELLPKIEQGGAKLQGYQAVLNVSFPGYSGAGEYGIGLSLNTVAGGEFGTEQNLNKSGGKISIKKMLNSLRKSSLTGGAEFNWEKSGITDVQNGSGDATGELHALMVGGSISTNNSGNISGIGVTYGPGINIGATVDLPLIGVGWEKNKGAVMTGELSK